MQRWSYYQGLHKRINAHFPKPALMRTKPRKNTCFEKKDYGQASVKICRRYIWANCNH